LRLAPALYEEGFSVSSRFNVNYSHFLIHVRFVLASVATPKGESDADSHTVALISPDAFYKDSQVGDPQSWNEYAGVPHPFAFFVGSTLGAGAGGGGLYDSVAKRNLSLGTGVEGTGHPVKGPAPLLGLKQDARRGEW
jgi:hypothetical protein